MYSSIQLKPGANTDTKTENIIIIIITLCLQKGATIFLPLTWSTAEGFSKFFHPDRLSNNLQQSENKISHHNSNALLHYLVK